jgi:hypothetical protein
MPRPSEMRLARLDGSVPLTIESVSLLPKVVFMRVRAQGRHRFKCREGSGSRRKSFSKNAPSALDYYAHRSLARMRRPSIEPGLRAMFTAWRRREFILRVLVMTKNVLLISTRKQRGEIGIYS